MLLRAACGPASALPFRMASIRPKRARRMPPGRPGVRCPSPADRGGPLRTRSSAPLLAALLVASIGVPAATAGDVDGGLRSERAPAVAEGSSLGNSALGIPALGDQVGRDLDRSTVRPSRAARTLLVTDDADLGELRRHPLVDDVHHDPSLSRWVVSTRNPSELARQLRIQRLQADPVVVVQAASDALAPAPAAPSDPFYGVHWGAHLSALPHGLSVVRWPQRAPVIAVLDTGVAPHPELGDRLLPGADLVTRSGDGRTDPHGHGTNTALTAAAGAGDGRGSVGSCPRCRILPIRVLDAQGNGTSTAIAEGIRVAVDLGADVINISAGGTRDGGSFSYEDSAVAYAAAAGVPILASAGNAGNTTPQYPAAMSGIIAVAGFDENGGRATHSNHGSWIDVAAPWCSVVGTSTGASTYCGTSSSAPFASGLVGLRRATVGPEPVTVVRDRLRAATHPVSWVAAGRLDACAVVRDDAPTAVPSTTGWAAGAEPSSIKIDLGHPCGVNAVRVELGSSSATRSLSRGVGRITFASPGALDLASLPSGDHRLRITLTDPLGRSRTVDHTLVVTEVAPAVTEPALHFSDVLSGSTHEGAIYWLADRGITRGCTADGMVYCPAASVTRAQMATFLRAALSLPAGPEDTYLDVVPGSTHATAIGALRQSRITLGCDRTGDLFCPTGSVTRAQMASFLTRGLDLAVPTDPTPFLDVPEDAPHADAVAALAAAGVTGGCSADGTRFCPDAPVTRAQMATFLRNALDG
jgi:hypothetical protein